MIPLGIIAAAQPRASVPPGPWTPASLAVAPEVWLNDDGAVTDAGSGACAQWNDLSGNGWHFTQDTGSNRPLIVTSGLNGRRTIRFDGSNDRLVSVDARGVHSNALAGWALAVYKKTAADGSAMFRSIFSDNTGAQNSRFSIQAGSSLGANVPFLGARRLDGDSASSLVASGARTSVWTMYLGVVDWSNGDGFIYLDGELDASTPDLTSSGATSNTTSATNNPAVLGASVAGGAIYSSHADIEVAELIVGAGVLPSSTEIDKLFGYLAHRWGLAGNLPVGHPYKSAPPTL